MENNELYTDHETNLPQEKLYDLNTVMVATFLGGPLGGGYVLYRNYKKLNAPEGATNTIVWAFMITAVLFGALFMLPEHMLDQMPNFLIPGLSVGAAYFAGKKLQGDVLDNHKAEGGEFHSRWNAVWMGLVAAVVTMMLLVPLVLL